MSPPSRRNDRPPRGALAARSLRAKLYVPNGDVQVRRIELPTRDNCALTALD